ncbi:hypothetical protein GW17_00034066 [Ensete ventricosum]|nr:hypothetical protein GW17_00034066 [Ensete ventricosum]RZR88970.1 hypothetical protein BHM03_00016627 [Ensete ventricosum]
MIPLLSLQKFMSLIFVHGKLCAFVYVLSSTSTPFMRLQYFAKFHPSCFTPRFALR